MGRRPGARCDREDERGTRRRPAHLARFAGTIRLYRRRGNSAIAEALNLSKAEVLGVVGFYHDFRRAPVEGATLKLCRAESCQALGCEGLVAHLSQAHGLKVDHVDANAPLGVETVYCLGNCALSPAGLLDGEPIGRLDRDAIDEIVARTAKRRA